MTATSSGSSRFFRNVLLMHVVVGAIFVVGAVLIGGRSVSDFGLALVVAGAVTGAMGLLVGTGGIASGSKHNALLLMTVAAAEISRDAEERRGMHGTIATLLTCGALLMA